MAISRDKNVFLILDIPAVESSERKSLPDTCFYFSTLNEESFAFANIDSYGYITNPTRFDGVFIENNHGEFGVILGHEFSPFIFRGQNKDYPQFVPTANRYKLQEDDGRLKHCIDWVKNKNFCSFL